jgi:hypothetical protein
VVPTGSMRDLQQVVAKWRSGGNGTENSLKVCYWLGRVAFRAKISHRDK